MPDRLAAHARTFDGCRRKAETCAEEARRQTAEGFATIKKILLARIVVIKADFGKFAMIVKAANIKFE